VTWNPLNLPYKYYHNGNRTKAIEFTNEMAKMIIDISSVEDKFWTTTAVDIFTGFILLLFEEKPEEECHLKGMAELWNEYLNNRKETLRNITKKYNGTLILQKLSYLNNNSEKTVGSMEAFITMGLNKLAINEEFMQFLSIKGMDIESMTEGKKAIYLIIPDENTSYHFVASLFLEQLYEVLIRKAQQQADNKLPVRMNFLIDEFANIPKIVNMDSMITASRSRNIRFHLIVQGMEQLRHKYGEEAEILSGNCNNWIYLYSKEFSLLQDLSRLCGEVIYDNNVRMPLFSEFDLQHLDKDKGEALVLAGRSYPCLSNLADINEYPYPQLDAANYITVADWKEIETGKEDNQSSRIYSLPISPERMEARPIGWGSNEKKWVVAVGPEDMIIADGVYRERDIQLKIAQEDLSCRVLHKELISGDEVKWFVASELIGMQYHERLKKEPERIYLTIPEIGEVHFNAIGGKFMNRRIENISEKLQIKIEMLSESRLGEEDVLYEETIPNYGGMLGYKYAYNRLFRKAAELLKGTEFERVMWEEGAFRINEVYFRKAVDEENCVFATIRTIREERRPRMPR